MYDTPRGGRRQHTLAPEAPEEAEPAMESPAAIVPLPEDGQPVFRIFSGEHTPGQGAVMVQNRETDFIFYSLERGPSDIPAMEAYMQGMVDGAGEDAIQSVLAACREFDVPCGITAGVDDIGERLEQCFRVIIVTDPEVMIVGRAATGRNQRVGVCLWDRLEELLYAADYQG